MIIYMSNKLLLFFIALTLPMVSVAGTLNTSKNNIVDTKAQDISVEIHLPADVSTKIKKLYLSAKNEQKQGNFEEAIKIYQDILDENPGLVTVRYELALCYIKTERWYRADYNLRLAMAGEDIPEEVKQQMLNLRYVVRKNKYWNQRHIL